MSDVVHARGPLVSVIVLCYNQAQYVEQCLDAIRAQTMREFQLIVCDDASTDDSVEHIRRWVSKHRPDATILSFSSNRGICAVLNHAMTVVSGKYVSMIAADDVWERDKIERQLRLMEQLPNDVAVVYSDALLMDKDANALPGRFIDVHWPGLEPPSGDLFPFFATRNFIPAMATLIRADAIREVGGYDERLPYEDHDMWIRLSSRFSFHYMNGTVARYRDVPGSLVKRTSPIPGNLVGLVAQSRLADKLLAYPRLTSDQRVQWSNILRQCAMALYQMESKSASYWLRRAYVRAPEPELALASMTSLLGIPYDWVRALNRFMRRYLFPAPRHD